MRVTDACFERSGCSSISSFQPWYAPDENFKDEELSGNDKLNVETIVKYENKIHQELSTKPITRALLDGLFLEDASQMRQRSTRVTARFSRRWLQKYFPASIGTRPIRTLLTRC